LNATFYVCLISNGLAAAYAPIQDCDEIFNYWEPTHYLDHGYGLQTWEYSPEYSIRSWLYVGLHAAIGKVSSFWSPRKTVQFYAIRFALAFICAACETRLYSAISRALNPRIGFLFLMIVAFSPGFFHASAAYLPSSFAMYTSMLGLTAFLDRQGKHKVAEGIMWFGVGSILGWPFAGALLLPLLFEETLMSLFSGNLGYVIVEVLNGGIRSLLVLVGTGPSISRCR
jgi:alpha-1,2-mannosyltransferase